MAKNRVPWFMNPKSPTYKRYMKGQQNPMGQYIKSMNKALDKMTVKGDENIQRLNALASRDVNLDPSVQALNLTMQNAPSRESINEQYNTAKQNLADYVSKVDFGAGGKTVGDITAALGTAIGADLGQTKDVAQTAGTVSGMGGQGGDVYSKAILGGAAAAFEGQKAQRMSDVEAGNRELGVQKAQLLSQLIGQRDQYGVAAGQATSDLRARRADLGMEIGKARSENAAAYDPFKLPMQLQALYGGYLQNQGALADLRKKGGKARGASSWGTGGTPASGLWTGIDG